jgi:long-chain fatty acid transport protein
MSMMRFQRNVLACCVTGLLSSPLYAQGFALNEQSIVSMGSAHAGRAALTQDASVIYTNPAALAQLKQRQFAGNATFIKAYTDIDAESAKTATGQDIQSPPTTNDGDIVPNVEIASSFLALPMHDTGRRLGGWRGLVCTVWSCHQL